MSEIAYQAPEDVKHRDTAALNVNAAVSELAKILLPTDKPNEFSADYRRQLQWWFYRLMEIRDEMNGVT